MIELPFVLRRDGTVIRGRIDAVYELDGGGLEIVDFKTGKAPEIEGRTHQLELYAEALRALDLVDEDGDVRLTYASLGESEAPATDGSN
jgi:DNA helicase-2/ATP-dependent DNA helicase PcrA